MASIVSVVCQSLLQPHVGPLFSVAAFLIMPLVLAAVMGEWWTVLVAPLVFWGYAWLLLWPSHLVVTTEDLLVAVPAFTIASLVGSALGLQLRRLRAPFKKNSISG
jgi:hypothetical protein